jgi:hypothetical protein
VAAPATGARLQRFFRFFRLPSVPYRNRRISRHPLLRHGPLDLCLAGSEHGAQNGQHVKFT